jgi:phage major head subunit gpT-like protein
MTVQPNLHERRASLPLQARLATIETRDTAARTVVACFTSGAAVMRPASQRYGREHGGYEEVLLVSEEAIDLTRFGSGRAPVLDSHGAWSTHGQLAIVSRAWLDAGKGYAEIRFPSAGVSPQIDEFVGLVLDGQRPNVSVGYTVDQVRIEPGGEGRPERWVVERWTPYELSFVVMGADAEAHVMTGRRGLGADDREFPVIITAPALPPAEAERQRVLTLSTIAARVPSGLPADFLSRHIAAGSDEPTFRSAVLNHLAEESDRMQTFPHITVGASGDDPAGRRDALTNALMHRLGVPGVQLTERGREFRALRMVEAMRQCLEDAGERTRGISDLDVISKTYGGGGGWLQSRFHVTSDFPQAFGNALNASLKAEMELAESGVSRVVAISTANDFREQSEIGFSGFPFLDETPEGAEIKFGTFHEDGEKVKAASYTKGMNVSVQLMMNDNIGAIDRAVAKASGRTAAELKTRVSLAALGAALSDGLPVFHATHNNLGTAAALSVESIGSGRLAMRQQTEIGSTVPMGIGPAFLMVPSALETEAERVLAPIAAATSQSVNPFAGRIELAVEPRLVDPLAWYLFASPSLAPVLRFVTLVGYEAPRLEMQPEFTRLGINFRVVWHVGCAPVDFRGAYKNPGAAPE